MMIKKTAVTRSR